MFLIIWETILEELTQQLTFHVSFISVTYICDRSGIPQFNVICNWWRILLYFISVLLAYIFFYSLSLCYRVFPLKSWSHHPPPHTHSFLQFFQLLCYDPLMSSRHCYVNVLNPSVFVVLQGLFFYSVITFFLDDVDKTALYQDSAAVLMRTIKGAPCIF